MKKALKILGGILVGLVLIFAGLELSLNRIVRTAVNAAGPAALGVPISLQKADISLVRGRAALAGLHVGNPEGYKTDGLLDLGSIVVTLDRSSLFADVVHVKKIAINGLVVTYERGLFNSNLGALIDRLAVGAEDESKKTAEKKDGAEKPSGKKVVIDQLAIADSQMKFSVTGAAALTGGSAVPLPLPPITLANLGQEKGGVTLVEAIQNVLKAIAGATGTAIVGAGNLLGDGVGAVGDGTWALGAGAVNLVTGGGKSDESAAAAEAAAPTETNASSKTAAEALGHLLEK